MLKVYQHLQQQQTIGIQFAIPIVDWGVNKSKRLKAATDLLLVEDLVKQENDLFEKEIVTQVMNWNMLVDRLYIATESKDIAISRYELSKQKYINGSINFTELNYAGQQKDLQINEYISNLKEYWTAYYLLRKLTLFDFQRNERIK